MLENGEVLPQPPVAGDVLRCGSSFVYEGVSKSFRNGRLERELRMVQLTLGAVVSLFCESV
jgi:hypothetical protein